MLITIGDSPTELMQAWRRQLGQRARLAERHGPRPFAVVGYRVRGPVIDGCVPLRHLTLVALFDELTPVGHVGDALGRRGGQRHRRRRPLRRSDAQSLR